jgi:hypothetical protein
MWRKRVHYQPVRIGWNRNKEDIGASRQFRRIARDFYAGVSFEHADAA